MKNKIFLICIYIVLISTAFGENKLNNEQDVHPLELEFQRLAVRRFIFSNNINLNEFIPSEIVAFSSMHPAFSINNTDKALLDTAFIPQIEKGQLILRENNSSQEAHIYMGGVNPYATYEMNAENLKQGEAGIEIARYGLRDRIQVIVNASKDKKGVYFRSYQDSRFRQEIKFTDNIPEKAFTLRVQLYGYSLGVFIEENKMTKYIGHIPVKNSFKEILDLRKPSVSKECTFNLISDRQGVVTINECRSYLSSGIGQADIRLITYEDLSPCMDNNRLWFTFSCRGIEI